MHYSCLCDSAKDIFSKPLSEVVGENVFGQSVCSLLSWKLFKNPCTSWLD